MKMIKLVKDLVLNIKKHMCVCISGIGDKQGNKKGPDPSFGAWNAVELLHIHSCKNVIHVQADLLRAQYTHGFVYIFFVDIQSSTVHIHGDGYRNNIYLSPSSFYLCMNHHWLLLLVDHVYICERERDNTHRKRGLSNIFNVGCWLLVATRHPINFHSPCPLLLPLPRSAVSHPHFP